MAGIISTTNENRLPTVPTMRSMGGTYSNSNLCSLYSSCCMSCLSSESSTPESAGLYLAMRPSSSATPNWLKRFRRSPSDSPFNTNRMAVAFRRPVASLKTDAGRFLKQRTAMVRKVYDTWTPSNRRFSF